MASPQNRLMNLPEAGSMTPRRPLGGHEFGPIRSHVRDYSRGVFKPPPPYRQTGIQPSVCKGDRLQLPRGQFIEHLINNYYETIHSIMPILHWPQFSNAWDDAKVKGDLSEVTPAWASVLFAVLALGVVYSTDLEVRRLYPDQGKGFIVQSQGFLDLFNDDFSMDHARGALLTSIYLTEVNCKSAAWTWLGSTVRIAQDIGLHRQSGPWPVVEGEMRRRVWWGIYAWDR